MSLCSKLWSLSLESLSSIVQCLWVRPGAYPKMEHMKGALFGLFQAMQTRFIKLGHVANPKNFLRPKFTDFHNKPTQVKYLFGTPFQGWPLALPSNIRLGWKGLLGPNTSLLRKSVKKFYRIPPRGLYQKTFDSCN